MTLLVFLAASAPARLIPARPHSRHTIVLAAEQSSQFFDDTHFASCLPEDPIGPATRDRFRAAADVSTFLSFLRGTRQEVGLLPFDKHYTALIAGRPLVLLIDCRGQEIRRGIGMWVERENADAARYTLQPDCASILG
jgi:hypothetical protein